MKKVWVLLLVMLLLCGCDRGNEGIDRVMSLRTDLLNANGCSFEAQVTADFTEATYTFKMRCQSDKDGNLEFEVLEPEYISGITGAIGGDGGKLTFDDTALTFALQTDGMLSPVGGPWVLMRALRGGYVRYCTQEEALLRVTMDDSYEDDALTLDLWVNGAGEPVRADIYENNRRIITITVKNYQLR
jgi:hypothetical protein